MPTKTTKNGNGTLTVVKTEAKKFNRKKMGALEFINSVLVPESTSAITGSSGYKAWTENKSGKTYINFVSAAYQAKMDITQNYMFEVGNASGKSNVIAFKPEYSIIPDDSESEQIIETGLLDKFTNEMYKFSYNSKGSFTSLSNQELINSGTNKVNYFSGSSYTNQELERMAANLWLKQTRLAVNGTLSILGDPNIKPMTNISIICIMPSGLPHVTSGVYLVQTVTHKISGGLFTTELSVLRNELTVTLDENGNIQFEVGAANEIDSGEDDSSEDNSSNSGGSNGDSGSDNNTAKVSGKRSALIDEARKHIGKPYVWGGKGPDSFDCSGLVWYCMKAIGKVKSGYTNTNGMAASDEYGKLIKGSIEDLPAGCIVVSSGGGHVVITSGNGNIIHAPQPGESVCEVNGSWVTGIIAIRDPFA